MSASEWVERNVPFPLNADQGRCVEVLCSFSQPYNLQLIGDGWRQAARLVRGVDERWDAQEGDEDAPPLLWPVAFGPNYMIVHLLGTLATFDMPELTRLVLAGHEHAVRVEISPQIYRWVQTDDLRDEEPNTGAGACLRVALHARKRERGDDGHNWEWHPTIDQALGRG